MQIIQIEQNKIIKNLKIETIKTFIHKAESTDTSELQNRQIYN